MLGKNALEKLLKSKTYGMTYNGGHNSLVGTTLNQLLNKYQNAVYYNSYYLGTDIDGFKNYLLCIEHKGMGIVSCYITKLSRDESLYTIDKRSKTDVKNKNELKMLISNYKNSLKTSKFR